MTSQKIGRTTSKNGTVWGEIDVVLDGSSKEAESKEYDMTGDDGIPAGFRDPMVFQDSKEVSKLHMVFAAKHRMKQGSKEYLIPTVGHATSTDVANGYKEWTFEPPIRLPHYKDLDMYEVNCSNTANGIKQIEVPYVVQRKGYMYLFISTQDFPLEKTNAEKKAAFRGYVSKEGIDGEFEPLYGHVEEPEYRG